jgi:hypothetical protein
VGILWTGDDTIVRLTEVAGMWAKKRSAVLLVAFLVVALVGAASTLPSLAVIPVAGTGNQAAMVAPAMAAQGPALSKAEGPVLSGSSPEALGPRSLGEGVSAKGEAEGPVLSEAGGKASSLVSMELREASLTDALNLLFKDTGTSYTLAPGVSGKVTLSLNRVTFDQGLHAILDLNGLTYRKDPGNVYYITRNQQTTAPEPRPSPEASVPAAQKAGVFFIGPGGLYELQYLDCRDVATWFGGTIAGGAPMLPIPITGVSGTGLGTGGGGAIGTSALGGVPSGGVTTSPGVPYPSGAGSPVVPAAGTGSGSPSGGRGRAG